MEKLRTKEKCVTSPVFLFYKRGSEQELIDHRCDPPDVVHLAS